MLKKFARVFEPGSSTGAAAAAEGIGAVAEFGNKRYSHLLSPLKIRNVILKNRIHYMNATPHFLQGPETYPAEVIRTYYANLAKSAAILTVRTSTGGEPRKSRPAGDSAHMAIWDGTDPAVRNYVDQIMEGIHSMGSLVSGSSLGGGGRGPSATVGIEELIRQAKELEDQGHDVVGMRVSGFRDKKAVDAAKEQMHAVRNATNLLIMISMTIIDPLTRPNTQASAGGILIADAIEVAKTYEDSADILFFKPAGSMTNHPTGWNMEKEHIPALRIAQALKESGTKIIINPNAGFRDPDFIEKAIASGKTDLVSMGRAFICEPDYGEKVYAGRGEDTTPCIMCNKCHGLSMTKDWITVCSVNPKIGLSSALKAINPPVARKKVAVIGGGPAGMKAAITAAERGHQVTLYEKNDHLGGLLAHADFDPYKWPHKDFKDYLIRQLDKSGVEVLLKVDATPEMIRARGYDAVLAAVGAEPVVPRIPGADGSNVCGIMDAFFKEKTLGEFVVFIGGGEFGVEAGMFLAKVGHKVMLLTSSSDIYPNDRVHYPEQVIDELDHLAGFDFIAEAMATRISMGSVTYRDAKGNEKSIAADSVVVYAGLRPRQEEAVAFYGSVENATASAFYSVGDCTGKCGNIQKSIRSAYFMASQV